MLQEELFNISTKITIEATINPYLWLISADIHILERFCKTEKIENYHSCFKALYNENDPLITKRI